MTKTKSTTNPGCAHHAYTTTPFHNINRTLFGQWETPWLYVVYSYSKNCPLFVYEKVGGTWMVNADKASRTTSKHRGQAWPREGLVRVPAQPRSCAWLKELIYDHQRAWQFEPHTA
jgi:hypothetical protein